MCVCVHTRVILDVYIFAGSVVIPECAINRCAVRCVGTQVLSADHCIFHLCTYPSYDYQHMVSCTMNCKLLLLCWHSTDFFCHPFILNALLTIQDRHLNACRFCACCRWFFAMISISGVFAVTFSVVFAYVADVTEEQERYLAYGLVSGFQNVW